MNRTFLQHQLGQRESVVPFARHMVAAALVLSAFCACAHVRTHHTIDLSTTLSGAVAQRNISDGPLIVGYASWSECDSHILEGVRNGVNVVIWFATNLDFNATTSLPVIHSGPNYTCVAETAGQIKREGLATTHLISVGGWDAPHPNTTITGAEWYTAWETWNSQLKRPDLGFDGFDGVDWDLEGNDVVASRWNHFTPECLELVGTMSQQLKSNGFIVSMAPPQSYFDHTTSEFNLGLLNSPSFNSELDPKDRWHDDFQYQGRNAYAYLISRYGKLPDGTIVFDFVSIQFYESFSPADYALTQQMIAPPEYFGSVNRGVSDGWSCNFSSVPALNFSSRKVSLLPSQIVWGFSFGSGGDSAKSLFVDPKDINDAFTSLPSEQRPRGFMFWNLKDDGKGANGTTTPCFFARSFNDLLHIRD